MHSLIRVMKMLKRFLLLGLVVLAFGCTKSSSDDDNGDNPSPSASATPQPSQSSPDFGPRNPDCNGIQQFTNGTLWKPESDSDENVVFLISNTFQKQFDSCSVRTRAGVTEQLQFFYFANNRRQNWRGIRPGAAYVDNAQITCIEPRQVCIFQFNGSSAARHE